jgi:soluble lytic murein transglycosylase-like protein
VNPLLLGGLAVAAVGGMLYSAKAFGKKETPVPLTNDQLTTIFQTYGKLYKVDPLLLRAIAITESNLKADAVRWNPPSDISVGLMQILYIPSDLQNLDSPPTNRFNVNGWNVATFNKLKDANFNVSIGAQILAWNLRTYGYPKGIAVYNSYAARASQVAGPFPNAAYVQKVLSAYSQLKRS